MREDAVIAPAGLGALPRDEDQRGGIGQHPFKREQVGLAEAARGGEVGEAGAA